MKTRYRQRTVLSSSFLPLIRRPLARFTEDRHSAIDAIFDAEGAFGDAGFR